MSSPAATIDIISSKGLPTSRKTSAFFPPTNSYHFRLYAYVLMDYHIQLLIETKDVSLSKVLQGINQSYTLYFNKAYKTRGHLFQDRYKTILCDQERYFLALLNTSTIILFGRGS
jgi:REP element-mobilizing transposase RayT